MALGDGIYWDSCIFYALLKGEKHRDGELEAIKRQAKAFDEGNLYIITSSITLTEVMPAKLEQAHQELFAGMHKRSTFVWVDANPKVTGLAVELRTKFVKTQPITGNNLWLSTPDAIHIASAISVGVPELITLDGNDKPKLKETSMLEFSNEIEAQYGLKIMRPDTTGQIDLYE